MSARRIAVLLLALALVGAAAWFAWSKLAARTDVASAVHDAEPAADAPARATELSSPREAPRSTPTDAEPATAEPTGRRAAEPVAKPESEGFVVRGRVYDAASGEPWFGATIEARYHDGEPFLETESDEAGLYRIEFDGGAPARLDLVAFVEERAALMHADLATDTGDDELVVDFALPGAFAIAGRVLDAKTRQPIEGAEVKVLAAGLAFAESWNDGFTDELGRFHLDELEGLPRSGLELVVRAEEHQPAHLARLAVKDGADTLQVEVLLGEPVVLRGRVVEHATGAPIADARVETSAKVEEFAEAGDETHTEDDGTFELSLGELALEDALLYVQAKGFATHRRDDLTVQPGNLEVRLDTPRTLHGRVLDAATGTPVGAAELTLTPVGMPDSVAADYSDTVIASADGTFELPAENVPIGPARLRVDAEGFAVRTWDVGVPADNASGRLDLKLERALVVRGRVTRLADGEPVKGARVRALLARERDEASPNAWTDKDGAYELELAVSAARTARWVLEYQGRRRALGTLEIAAAPPPELVHDFTLDLPAPRGIKVDKPKRPPTDDIDK